MVCYNFLYRGTQNIKKCMLYVCLLWESMTNLYHCMATPRRSQWRNARWGCSCIPSVCIHICTLLIFKVIRLCLYYYILYLLGMFTRCRSLQIFAHWLPWGNKNLTKWLIKGSYKPCPSYRSNVPPWDLNLVLPFSWIPPFFSLFQKSL